MTAKVDDRSSAALALGQEWPMLEALNGGTYTMRRAGEKLLPRWPAEDLDAYKARLATATLFPAYRRTVSVMVGKPFAKELTWSDDADPDILKWADDIDREGVSLHVFAAEMFEESFFGLAGILVEAPRPVATTGAVATVQDQKAAGVRPYFVRVKHNQILGWRTEARDGARVLTQLRILECETVPDGAFGEAEIEQVRVLEPGSWTTYRKDARGHWLLHLSGTTDLPVIPFVPLYGRRRGFMDGVAPLIDLAYLNVEHWQSKSDQQTILHAARVPILFGKGFPAGSSVVVSASTATLAEHVEADLKWVEHTGKSIEAGASSLRDLENEMIQSGAELLVKKPGTRTATESANDAEGNKSDLQRMVENLEDALNLAISYLGAYAKKSVTGTVQLFKDFGATSLDGASALLIKDLAVANIISKETAISELQRRGELAPEVDAATEAERIEEQGPDLGDIVVDPLKPKPAPAAA